MRRTSVVAAAMAVGLGLLAPPSSAGHPIEEHTLVPAGTSPVGITTGPGGKLWFSLKDGNAIASITTDFDVQTFPLPTRDAKPAGVWGSTDGDGSVWFVEERAGQIGRLGSDGVITEYRTPTRHSKPHTIVKGPDGNFWFTEQDADQIGRITPDGVITEFPLPRIPGIMRQPDVIVSGPDGQLWFTEYGGNRLGSITTSGVVGPGCDLGPEFAGPHGLTVGQDGNLWLTEEIGNAIARVTTTCERTRFPLPQANSHPVNIAVGPSGSAMWFTEQTGGNRIGRITIKGVITHEVDVPTPNSDPGRIVAGPDGNMWFVEVSAGKIGKLLLDE